jgi:DNA invertase Pin-like site-specific DNA recombinase
LTRKAIIYIRQSSPHQVLTNQESLRLQYALRERAVELGWRTEEIEIIDGVLVSVVVVRPRIIAKASRSY